MRIIGTIVFAVLLAACNDDPEADRKYVGGQCGIDDDCYQEDEDFPQTCLTQFAGGYCGIEGCVDNLDCPEASACVAHTDGNNYCFRVCIDKVECNRNRDVENESNCSANITFTDSSSEGLKACVPPSSG